MSKSVLRQIRIKEGSCRRLTKDIQAYQREKDEQTAKLVAMRIDGDENDIRRQTDFLNETEATIRDTLMNLNGSFTELQQTVERFEEDEAAVASEEYKKAIATLILTGELLGIPVELKEVKQAPAPETKNTTTSARRIAVFGSSQTLPGSATWDLAIAVGHALASASCHVLNGGYSGTMEAVSEGAARVEGAVIEGVLVPSVFSDRHASGNPHLTVRTETASLQERLSLLISADAFVVLPGSIGTLTELFLVWNHSVVSAAKPIFVTQDPWQAALTPLMNSLGSAQHLEKLAFFSTAEELSALVNAL
jgi:uncharacterized protein (TIGR00725 family)